MISGNEQRKTMDETNPEDLERMTGIISSLHYLKDEARKSEDEDIVVLIESVFSVLLTTYCVLMRSRQAELAMNDMAERCKCFEA